MRSVKLSRVALVVGAIGVVFGDIGTSPLYALQAAFGIGELPINETTIYGVISVSYTHLDVYKRQGQ